MEDDNVWLWVALGQFGGAHGRCAHPFFSPLGLYGYFLFSLLENFVKIIKWF